MTKNQGLRIIERKKVLNRHCLSCMHFQKLVTARRHQDQIILKVQTCLTNSVIMYVEQAKNISIIKF